MAGVSSHSLPAQLIALAVCWSVVIHRIFGGSDIDESERSRQGKKLTDYADSMPYPSSWRRERNSSSDSDFS